MRYDYFSTLSIQAIEAKANGDMVRYYEIQEEIKAGYSQGNQAKNNQNKNGYSKKLQAGPKSKKR